MVKKKQHQKDSYDDQLVASFQNFEDGPVTGIKNKPMLITRFDYIVFFCLISFMLIHTLTYIESFHWHLSAIGRILLIKLLPIYDWRHMKNQQCLIEKSNNDPNESVFNCDLCENIRRINVHDSIEEDELEERYINLDVPVVLIKGIEHWPKDSQFLQDLLSFDDFSSSFPCKLSSNIVKDFIPAGEILVKAQHFDEFFIHFQNCDSDAMRVLRRFTFRPHVLPAAHSPSIFNWIIWNKNYNTTAYKTVELIEKLTIFGQIMGSTDIRLIPRKNCELVCPTLDFQIFQGEMLIFTSLWDLEYRCNEAGENLAAVMEIRN